MSPCHVPKPRPSTVSLCPPAVLPRSHIMSPCPLAVSLRCDPQCSPTGGAPSCRGAEEWGWVLLPPGCVRATLLPAARGSPACREVFCNHLLQRAAINGTGFEELTARAACWRAGSAQKAIGRWRAAPGAGSDNVGHRRCGAEQPTIPVIRSAAAQRGTGLFCHTTGQCCASEHSGGGGSPPPTPGSTRPNLDPEPHPHSVLPTPGDAQSTEQSMARRGAGTPPLLRLSLLLLLSPSGAQQSGAELDCASVAVGTPVVPMGSAITASCTIRRERCRGLEDGQPQISWLLDSEPMAGRQRRGVGGTEVSELSVPQLNRPQAKLWCCVEWNGTKQRVGMAEIRAGYPPGKPSNLSCLLDLGDYGLTCRWQQGADGHLPTNVMLKCATSRSPAVTGCTPQNGHSQCTVPRRLLQLYHPMELWVTATNALGTAESERLRIDPMDVAKLDPPTLQSIHSVPPQTDCVTLTWTMAPRNAHMEQCCELRYRAAEDPSWDVVTGIPGHAGTVQHCKFLFGMLYHFQMRCRRDSARGYWSEWSVGRNYTTHEKAPEGKLDAWWSTQPAAGRMEVQLRWKAPRRQEANGRVLGYRVALGSRRRGREPQTVCNTTDTQCDFTVPERTGRVYLSAYNAAGESSATEVVLLERKGQPLAGLQAVPRGERSLWVHWKAAPVPAVAYVLEWQQVSSEPRHCSACWQLERNGTTTATLIQDSIEPFQQYNISVYPLYKDAVGTPAHVAAYSKQKAPSHAPKLHLKSIGKSQAELSWEPVAVELQNGFITHYTVFWANSTAEVSSAVVNSSLSSFTIRGLKPSTLYKVHIMASTAGGSTNGTILTLVTTVLDDIEIQFLFLTLVLVFVLLIILLICFQKNGRVKQQFWPSVPDPANSSLGTWVPAEQEPLQAPGVKEPGLATISTVTVLDKAAGKQAPTWGKEPPAEPPAPPQPYMRQHGPSTLQATAGLGAEPVQYVQVVGGSSRGPQRVAPCLYLRSSSTQPLLSDPSPESYENLWFRGAAPSLEEPLLDFPLLRGLLVSGAEELHDFQPC